MKNKSYIKEDGEAATLDAQFFKKAKRGRPPMPASEIKKRVTIMLDQDVIEHFKAGGAGWQTRANSALRKAAGFEVFSPKKGINKSSKTDLGRVSKTGVLKSKPKRKAPPAKKRA